MSNRRKRYYKIEVMGHPELSGQLGDLELVGAFIESVKLNTNIDSPKFRVIGPDGRSYRPLGMKLVLEYEQVDN